MAVPLLMGRHVFEGMVREAVEISYRDWDLPAPDEWAREALDEDSSAGHLYVSAGGFARDLRAVAADAPGVRLITLEEMYAQAGADPGAPADDHQFVTAGCAG